MLHVNCLLVRMNGGQELDNLSLEACAKEKTIIAALYCTSDLTRIACGGAFLPGT